MYLLRSTLQDGHVQKDFTKFANQRFLKTVDWEVLGKLLQKHETGLKGLHLAALLADEIEGRKRITEYLLGSKASYPDGLIQDLHMTVGGTDQLDPLYREALAGIRLTPRHQVA